MRLGFNDILLAGEAAFLSDQQSPHIRVRVLYKRGDLFFFFNEQKAVRDITLIIKFFFLPLDYNLSAEFAVVKIVNFV